MNLDRQHVGPAAAHKAHVAIDRPRRNPSRSRRKRGTLVTFWAITLFAGATVVVGAVLFADIAGRMLF